MNNQNKLTVSESLEKYGTCFLDREQVKELTGMSRRTIEQMFNDPAFPANKLGNKDTVEYNAFLSYFSESRNRKKTVYWRNTFIYGVNDINSVFGGYYNG